MKADIHPKNYRKVIFFDATSGAKFLIGSTVETKEKGQLDGQEYPQVTIEISSASHPVYTGKEIMIDTAGRVDKFNKRRSTAANVLKEKVTRKKKAA